MGNAAQTEANQLIAIPSAHAEADRLAAEAAPREALSPENLRNGDTLFNRTFIIFVVSLVLLVVAVCVPHLKTLHHYRNCDRSWRFSPSGLRNLRAQGMLGFGTSTCGCGY